VSWYGREKKTVFEARWFFHLRAIWIAVPVISVVIP